MASHAHGPGPTPPAPLITLLPLFSCPPQRGLSDILARQVAHELTEKDVIRAHARDELGIDLDELANPLQVRIGARLPQARQLVVQPRTSLASGLKSYGTTVDGAFVSRRQHYRLA